VKGKYLASWRDWFRFGILNSNFSKRITSHEKQIFWSDNWHSRYEPIYVAKGPHKGKWTWN